MLLLLWGEGAVGFPFSDIGRGTQRLGDGEGFGGFEDAREEEGVVGGVPGEGRGRDERPSDQGPDADAEGEEDGGVDVGPGATGAGWRRWRGC